MKTEEIMKDSAYNYKLTERDNGHLSDIFRTFMGHLFTYIFNLCLPASSAQSVFYRIPPIIDDDKKPQMNADERRYFPASEFSKTIHRKGHKERKVAQHEPFLSLRPLRSLRLNVFSAPAHERAQPVPAVHLRTSRTGG